MVCKLFQFKRFDANSPHAFDKIKDSPNLKQWTEKQMSPSKFHLLEVANKKESEKNPTTTHEEKLTKNTHLHQEISTDNSIKLDITGL